MGFLTEDMVWLSKAATAAKCAVTSGFTNGWYLLAAAYSSALFARDSPIGFDAPALMEEAINGYYPVVCACLIEVDGLQSQAARFSMFSSGPNYQYYTDAACTLEVQEKSKDCLWS